MEHGTQRLFVISPQVVRQVRDLLVDLTCVIECFGCRGNLAFVERRVAGSSQFLVELVGPSSRSKIEKQESAELPLRVRGHLLPRSLDVAWINTDGQGEDTDRKPGKSLARRSQACDSLKRLIMDQCVCGSGQQRFELWVLDDGECCVAVRTCGLDRVSS